MSEWRYDLLGLLEDGQWHSYWDLVSLGCTMEYWKEKEFRKYLSVALETNIIKADGRNTDLKDLKFHIMPKGDEYYVLERNKLIGTHWYEYHKDKLKYFKNIRDQEEENKEYFNALNEIKNNNFWKNI